MSVHPRLSVNSLSSLFQSLDADITMWRELGADHVGVITPKLAQTGWDTAKVMVVDAGLRVSNVSSETDGEIVGQALEFAAAVGAGVVYICSGRAGPRPWEEAADAFCTDIAPHVARARELGVRLGVEPTNPLRSDVSFVFCVRDALALARAAGMDIVLDLYSCWYERDLDRLIRENVDMLALVQICDYALGTFDTPNRAALGDGDIPVEHILATVIDAGYQGAFDLEILGPRIEAEGYPTAIRRSLERGSEMLDRLGA
jgi:sugar phosphate isomerase/epimerase